jgi:hypothetical protein
MSPMLATLLALLFTAAEVPAPRPAPAAWPAASTGFAHSAFHPQLPAARRASFFLVLDRPGSARLFGRSGLKATLAAADGARRADVLIPTGGRVYALWYDLPPGIHRLVVSSPKLFFADRVLELPAGQVGYLAASLKRRPRVKVRLDLPARLIEAGPLEIEMRPRRPLAPAPEKWPVPTGAREMVISNLPPVDAEFTLHSPPWKFKTRLDLRDGKNGEIEFAPIVTEVFGNLTAGGFRRSDKIVFKLAGQEPVEVVPDELGRYQASLWRQEVYGVSVDLDDRQVFRRLVDVPVVLDQLVDLDVPSAIHRVFAYDHRNRRQLRISEALYRFVDEEGRELRGKAKIENGEGELPPLGFGTLDLTVKVRGYQDRRREGIPLWPRLPGADIVAWLEPVEAWVDLHLVDQDAQPVYKAEVRVLRDALADEIAWEGKSDHNGLVRVPGEYAGLPTLVRSYGHAFHVERLPDPYYFLPQWWLEEKPSKAETQVLVVDRERQLVAGADVLLGIGDIWLRGKSLAWLLEDLKRDGKTDSKSDTEIDANLGKTDAKPAKTGINGVLLLRNLPAEKLFLLASTAPIGEIELGGYAQLAKTVDSPAPRMLVVTELPTE